MSSLGQIKSGYMALKGWYSWDLRSWRASCDGHMTEWWRAGTVVNTHRRSAQRCSSVHPFIIIYSLS